MLQRVAVLKFLIVAASLLIHFTFSADVRADDVFSSAVRPTPWLSPEDEQKALKVPKGFRVSLFASEPMIQKPINMAFDSRGRLWVSGTHDYPYPDLKTPGDKIQILEDTNGDGRADKVTDFVDRITHPMGLLPYRDGVIAFCIPNIYFFRDTDGDGICDRREILYGPFDFSRDTHGLNNAFRRGFDGWVYACHGFNNHSVVTGPDGNTVDMNSGNTYRFRPDGSRIESFTFGQVNPFGMTFDERGDLFSSDCHTKPLMLMIKDGQYQGFGRKHDGLGFAPEVIDHLHGSTAIAGLSQISGRQFPKEFQQNFLIGNVMTSRVHRDSLAISGSSMKAVEMPDLVVSEDPWFRPVDIQMGADDSVYIADFYNRIIGHYEVPLQHAGRDRTSGRIWRVESVDSDDPERSSPSSSVTSQVRNLAVATLPELIQECATENLPRRIAAMNEISDRIGTDAVPALKTAWLQADNDHSKVSILWLLQRLNALDDDILKSAVNSSSEVVRIHTQRILADASAWTSQQHGWALGGLNDSNSFVKRAAADALARHPDEGNVRTLLRHWQQTPVNDPMLQYQLKLALRNQLRVEGTLSRLRLQKLTPQDTQDLVTIALGLDTSEAASFLLSLSGQTAPSFSLSVDVIEKIARSANPQETDQLVQIVQKNFADQLDVQFQMLRLIQDGLAKQGETPPASLVHWAETLVNSVMLQTQNSIRWTVVNTPRDAKSPWDMQTRKYADDATSPQLLSSHVGGEQAVSSIRSPNFRLNQSMTFWICGHRGFPNEPASELIYVRLCDAETHEELIRAFPPRTDVAQKVTWSIPDMTGKNVYFEAVDGLNLNAYAWLAFGRFEDGIPNLPTIGTRSMENRISQAVGVIRDLNLNKYQPSLVKLLEITELNDQLKSEIAITFASLRHDPLTAGIAALTLFHQSGPQVPELGIHALVTTDLLQQKEAFKNTLKLLSAREQETVARAILSEVGGADLILDLCQAKALSHQVLNSSQVRPQLDLIANNETKTTLLEFATNAPQSSEAAQERIKQIRQKLSESKGDPLLGKALFAKHCAACHQISGEGKIIGPQLDGIGTRGAERLFEDILIPNLNVDAAFRNRTYVMDDGRVFSGVFRRIDGATTIIANNTGAELALITAQIDEQVESSVSIMPENWNETLNDTELKDLLSYLLIQK